MSDSFNHLNEWHTWKEIHAQPEAWDAWSATFDVASVRRWVQQFELDEVWFCGAGSSAYIGDIVATGLEAQRGPRLRSVPSTDLVSRPQTYLNNNQCKRLFVSFGRSGNSSESIGTLDALDALAKDSPRLHITCNADSALATRAASGPIRTVVLPQAVHDSGFAMTGSFSTMVFTALAVFQTSAVGLENLPALAAELRRLLPQYAGTAGGVPERIVYLGSGPLAYAARESALKVMELSAGKIPALWDSCLGFRHGPKSFVTDNTSIVVFTGPDEPSIRYDTDLLLELRDQFPQTRVTSIGVNGDISFSMPMGPTWASPVCVAAAQVCAVIWSSTLGLNVDNPFAGKNTLSRVVADVALYPVTT